FECDIDAERYVFLCLHRNPDVSVHVSEERVTGVLSVRLAGKQVVDEGIGVESFEFWTPERRPGGRNIAVDVDPPLDVFAPQNVKNGLARPTFGPNAWVADP